MDMRMFICMDGKEIEQEENTCDVGGGAFADIYPERLVQSIPILPSLSALR